MIFKSAQTLNHRDYISYDTITLCKSVWYYLFYLQ